MSVLAANYAIRSCKLQDVAAKMVLTALAWKAPIETPHRVFMGNDQLRQETGLKSVNGVKDALRRLIAAGEVRVIEVGGRGQSTNYELVEVRRLVESGELSASDISNGDTKPSESDAKCQMATLNCQHLTPIDNKTLKTEDAASPPPVASLPPAISNPSQPPKRRERKPRPAHPVLRPDLGDEAWLAHVKALPQYSHVNFDRLLEKCIAWCAERKDGAPTRRRLMKWADIEQKPLTIGTKRKDDATARVRQKMLEEEREMRAAKAAFAAAQKEAA